MRHLPLKLLPSTFNCLPDLSQRMDNLNKSKIGSTISETETLKVVPEPPGSNPKVVSSVYGKIKTLVLFYPTNKDNRKRSTYCYFEFLKELIQKFKEGGRRFILVVKKNNDNLLSDTEKELLEVLANKNKNTLHVMAIDYRAYQLTPWAQDAFLAVSYKVEGENQIYLIEPSNEDDNSNAISLVFDGDRNPNLNLNFLHADSAVKFVGGNILAGDNFVLFGINKTTEEDIKDKGEKWFGKNRILLKTKVRGLFNESKKYKKTSDGYRNYYRFATENQVLFHLDVFITLAGKNKVGEEVFVIGNPVIGFPLYENLPDDIIEIAKNLITRTSKGIDELIRSLKAQLCILNIPYEIIRNPMPLTYYDKMEYDKKYRHWCWASYNNCLVESYCDPNSKERCIKNVLIPSYGIGSDYSGMSKEKEVYGNWTELHKYDLQNKWIWEEKLGYKVVLLHQDFNPFMRLNGSLNCLTNCIERE